MPKKIITETTMPVALSELDRWSGKLTWPLFCQRLSQVLGERGISRHTLLVYPELVDAFQLRKRMLKDANSSAPKEANVTLKDALKTIDSLEAKTKRLEKENELLREQFVRWQHNLYMMPNVDLEKLKQHIDKPLAGVDRRG